jgi:hypothetical protein
MGATEMICAGRFIPRLPHCLVLAILLWAGMSPGARAQEPRTVWVPRDEMVGAIIVFAATQCGKIDELLPELFAAHCKDPSGVSAMFMLARMALAHQSDAALRGLCTKHGIADCQTQEETSRGQPILVPDITVAVRGSALTSSWSPDNRFLLLRSGRSEGLQILDVESGQFVDKTLQKVDVFGFAWSPDGKHAALTTLAALRILSVGSWEELGTRLATKEGCQFQAQRYMAFTLDSRSLWVPCGGGQSSGQRRIAQKISVPELKVEDEMLLSPPPGAARMGFSALSIARHADNVVVTGTLYRYDEAGKLQAGEGVSALNLTRKVPVYPPFAAGLFIRHSDDLSRVLLYRRRATGPADKRGNAPVEWAVETWNTESGEQIGRFGGTTGADSTRVMPVAVPMSNLLVAAYGSRSSLRRTLIVMDDRSGAVLQEIGPMPSVDGIVVSPDGSRAAIYRSDETRIYKVNRQD